MLDNVALGADVVVAGVEREGVVGIKVLEKCTTLPLATLSEAAKVMGLGVELDVWFFLLSIPPRRPQRRYQLQ